MKLNFRKPCIEDKEKFDKIFKSFGNINSESAFGTSYIWADSKDIKICFEDDIFLKKVGNKQIKKGYNNEIAKLIKAFLKINI